MTVATTHNRKEYIGDAVQVAFPYDFLVLDEEHFEIYLDGVLKTLTTDYTVSGVLNQSGGNITFGTAPAVGVEVLILRVVPVTQGVKLPNTGSFPSETVEKQAFDKTVMIEQQMAEEIDRAIKLGKDSNLTDVEFPEPGAAEFIRWNSLGMALETAPAVFDNGNYLQSGTGAVLRTVDSKLGDWVSVKDFGAKGDGATDDRVAIQAAIDAHKFIYFPPGTYFLNSYKDTTDHENKIVLDVPADRYLMGCGEASKLQYGRTTMRRLTYIGDNVETDFAYNFLIADTDERNDHLRVWLETTSGQEDFIKQTITTHYTVTGIGNPAGGLIQFVAAPGSNLDIIIAFSEAYTLLDITGNNVTIENLAIDGNNVITNFPDGAGVDQWGIRAYGVIGTEYTNLTIRNCKITNVGWAAIFWRAVKYSTVTHNHIEGVGALGFRSHSVLYVRVDHNTVKTVWPGGDGTPPLLNAYGISFSNTSAAAATGDVCKYCTAIGNFIEDIPGWIGIQTHMGRYMLFSNNVVIDCGAGLGVENNIAGTTSAYVFINNNVVARPSAGTGVDIGDIARAGQVPDYAARSGVNINAAIDGEVGTDFGMSGNIVSQHRYGVGCENLNSLVISGNTIVDCFSRGIYMRSGTPNGQAAGVIITGNVIKTVRLLSGGSTANAIDVGAKFRGVVNNNYITNLAGGGKIINYPAAFDSGYGVKLDTNFFDDNEGDGAGWHQLSAMGSAFLGIAQAWVTFDGSATISDKFGVASVVRNSIGNYTITWNEAMDDTKYPVFATSTAEINRLSTIPTTTAVTILTRDNTGTNVDAYVCVVMFGLKLKTIR